MAGHAQLKFVMTECSKTQIRLTGLKSHFHVFAVFASTDMIIIFLKPNGMSMYHFVISFTLNMKLKKGKSMWTIFPFS